MKSYSELSKIDSFEGRLDYLRTQSTVGQETFASERYLNQVLYHSAEWKKVRQEVIVRDCGCDMGLIDYDILGRITVHHINPITVDDILHRTPKLFDLENLVCVSMNTHNLIHYGIQDNQIPATVIERKPNDTCPWK